MTKITLDIDGMYCAMCESHVNDALRKGLGKELKKVKSSHRKNTAVLICQEEVTRDKLEAALAPTGYRILNMKSEPYEKKGLF